MNDLEMYREQLALCDDKIIDALVERNSIIEKIMAYKEEYGMPILQPQQEEKQKKRLEEIETSVDPEIIGGIVVKVNNEQFDTSLRTRISEIAARLTNTIA